MFYPIDLEYSELRMNKYEVNRMLEANNIKFIPSVQIEDKHDLVSYKSNIDTLGWPILAKPSEDTAAMSGVQLVHNMEELDVYLDRYLGSKNSHFKDKIIKKVILQKYIPDDYQEFVIDFISYKSKHYCCGIVEYFKSTIEGNVQLFRSDKACVISEIPKIETVIQYVGSILEALNVVSGFTHNEIFWDKKDSFYLVEVNHRIAGNGIPEMYQNVYGFSALTQLLLLLQGKSIDLPILRQSYSTALALYNTSTPNASQLNLDGIKSVQKIIHFQNRNKLALDFYKDYTRADCISAQVLLHNNNAEKLELDIKTILNLEKIGELFR